MSHLLSDKNSEHFSSKFPIIFKNKVTKKDGMGFYYSTAMDNALKNNQIRAVQYLIEYIIKFQNNFVSSYLFQKNFAVLILRGVSLSGLLESNVFKYELDYDQWPMTHWNREWIVKPFNGSIFDIRYRYKEIFTEPEYQPMSKHTLTTGKMKIYKIAY